MSVRSLSLLHVLALGALGLTLACDPGDPVEPDAGTPDAGPVTMADESKSTLTGIEGEVPADGTTTFNITVKLRHRSGGALGNKQVELQVGGEGNTVTPAGLLTTDAQGVAEATVASTVPGVKSLKVLVHYDDGATQTLFTKELHFGEPPLTSLVFERQPGQVAAGASFAQPVRVKLLNKNGQPWAGTTTVSLSLKDASSGTSIFGTLTQQTVAGVAEFADLSFDKVADGLQLRAVTAENIAGESAAFKVVPGAVASFKVGEDLPTGFSATAGETFPLVVEAFDEFENAATNYTGTVQFTSTDRKAGLPTQYTFTPDDHGVQTFEVTLLTAGKPDVTVRDITRNALGLRSIVVGPAAAAMIRFAAVPGRVVGSATRGVAIRGVAISPEVQVTFLDEFENPDAVLDRAVQLRMALTGTTGAALGGTTTRSVARGRASMDFNDLVVDKVGGGYKLTATEVASGGISLAAGISGEFDVVANPCEAQVDPCSQLATTCNGSELTTYDLSGTPECRPDASKSTHFTCTNATERVDHCSTTETCSVAARACIPDTCAASYDDGVACTVDACDSSGSATHTPNDALCGANAHCQPGAAGSDPVTGCGTTDVCAGVTCSSPPATPTCSADATGVITAYAGACVASGGQASCEYTPSTTTPCGTGEACVSGACVAVRAPVAGDLVITEVMHSPSAGTTEYFEVYNLSADRLNLAGITVSKGASGATFTLPTTPVLVDAHSYFVFAQNKDAATNGGVTAHHAYGATFTLEAADELHLARGTTKLEDLVWTSPAFPQTAGRAMNLSSQTFQGEGNTHSWYWCDATASLTGGDFGTPGAANGACGVNAQGGPDWCAIQWPKSQADWTSSGYSTTAPLRQAIYGRFYEPSITDRRQENGEARVDFYPNVEAELGVGTGADVASWTWTKATFNADYHVAANSLEAGSDEVMGYLELSGPGSYTYGFRFRFLDPATGTPGAWTYCGQNAVVDPATTTEWGAVTTTVGPGRLVITEVDYDNVGGDTAEFIELRNVGSTPVALAGLKLVLINGANNTEYYFTGFSASAPFNLSAAGTELAPGEYLVIGANGLTVPAGTKFIGFNPGSSGGIQNGDPDALGIWNTTTNAWVDRLSYSGTATTPAATAPAAYGSVSMLEGTNTTSLKDSNTVQGSLIRYVNGADTDVNGVDFFMRRGTPTPGAPN